MKSRRTFILSMTAGLMALALVVAPVIAEELLGVITKVDVDAKKVTVVEKDTDKEIQVTINDKTEQVTKKGTGPVDLEKLEKRVAKAQEKGAKGAAVKIEHEKGVASKIEFTRKAAN
ncbi:hypothetical protein ACYOEI_22090 [Singulisphaera rosea]